MFSGSLVQQKKKIASIINSTGISLSTIVYPLKEAQEATTCHIVTHSLNN